MTLRRMARTGGLALGTATTWWTTRHLASPAVRHWRPSHLRGQRAGALHVRHGGDRGPVGDHGPVIVLLHGLVATGEIFGAAFDSLADEAILVVPDLLGFGQSLDESRPRFEPDDHLDALDEMLDTLGLADRPLIVGAHSMGGSVAVRWARRRGAQIERLVCWGPPVYPDAHAVDTALAESGIMAKLFAADTAWAERACQISCAHRILAGIAAAVLSPSLSAPIARAASMHTWPAYRDAMEYLVAGTGWSRCLRSAAGHGTTVELTLGSHDPIGDRDHAAGLADVSVRIVDGGHHLPLTHPAMCRSQLSPALRAGRD